MIKEKIIDQIRADDMDEEPGFRHDRLYIMSDKQIVICDTCKFRASV